MRRSLLSVALLLVLSAALLPAAPAASASAAPLTEKAIFFASDGMRPDFVDRYAAEGLMPTFA
jgi:hypothetical protein